MYDPVEYHGPTLNYFTLPVVWGSGAKTYEQTTEATYRMVTVLFGVGLILLLGLVVDGLGWAEVLCAGGLIASSPAMRVLFAVLHSRDTVGVFHISRHRVWVEVFAEREEAVGVSGWDRRWGWLMRRRRRGC
jgi:hypothetical protein